MKKPKGTGLKFVYINDLSLIPRYLVDQVKGRDWTTDAFYDNEKIIVNNPFGVLGAFVDKELVKGFLWASVSPLDMNINVHALSVDKEFQGKTILKEAANIMRKIRDQLGLKKIRFITSRPNAMESAGFKRTNRTIMEVV